jgi:hypothetical protein
MVTSHASHGLIGRPPNAKHYRMLSDLGEHVARPCHNYALRLASAGRDPPSRANA